MDPKQIDQLRRDMNRCLQDARVLPDAPRYDKLRTWLLIEAGVLAAKLEKALGL